MRESHGAREADGSVEAMELEVAAVTSAHLFSPQCGDLEEQRSHFKNFPCFPLTNTESPKHRNQHLTS